MKKAAFSNTPPTEEKSWEQLWAPYSENIYRSVLAQIKPDDVVLEIGAGDLRLACQLSKAARKVYAIEIHGSVMSNHSDYMQPLIKKTRIPANLKIIIGDARKIPFPDDITVGVLLMRYCYHFQLYEEKLLATHCTRLITNSRWRMGVETINLLTRRIPYDRLPIGWYACWCGHTGFKPGEIESVTPEVMKTIHEVTGCPYCKD